MKITLCGIKHAGKTSAGKALAKMLDLPFADTDDILQDLYNTRHNTALSVREIFRALGSDLFRQLEAEAIRTLAGKQGVFALGGGALSNPYVKAKERKLLGFLCTLNITNRTAYERIEAEGLPPFLQGKKNPFRTFCQSNTDRRRLFRQFAAASVTAGPTPEDSARKILDAYKKSNTKDC